MARYEITVLWLTTHYWLFSR